jgi:hypothetical protein
MYWLASMIVLAIAARSCSPMIGSSYPVSQQGATSVRTKDGATVLHLAGNSHGNWGAE